MRENVLLESGSTLGPELLLHKKHVIQWKTQLSRYVESLADGSIGRFEAVFDAAGLDDYFRCESKNFTADDSDDNEGILGRFRRLYRLLLRSKIIKISVGNWWKEQNLGDFLRNNFKPYMQISNKIRENESRYFLRKIYDLEFIVQSWSLGSINNRSVDCNRFKFLMSKAQTVQQQLQQRKPFFPLRYQD